MHITFLFLLHDVVHHKIREGILLAAVRKHHTRTLGASTLDTKLQPEFCQRVIHRAKLLSYPVSYFLIDVLWFIIRDEVDFLACGRLPKHGGEVLQSIARAIGRDRKVRDKAITLLTPASPLKAEGKELEW